MLSKKAKSILQPIANINSDNPEINQWANNTKKLIIFDNPEIN